MRQILSRKRKLTNLDGGWSQWAEFESCSLTCDGGLLGRMRLCINPPPQNGGRECQGLSFDTIDCNTEACPSGYELFKL